MKYILVLLLFCSCATQSSFRESEYFNEHLSFMKKEGENLIYYGTEEEFKEFKSRLTKEDYATNPMAYSTYVADPALRHSDEHLGHNEAILTRISENYEKLYSKNASDRRSRGAYIFFSALAAMGGNPNTTDTVRAPSSQTCSSDYECPSSHACINKSGYGIGTCAKVVDQNGLQRFNYKQSQGVKEAHECFLGVDC